MSSIVVKKIEWLNAPEDHDFPAAVSYLSLIFTLEYARDVVDRLKSPTTQMFYKSKDIFRASGLTELTADNKHVKKNIEKIEKGEALSPLLLVRHSTCSKVIVADGYHRLCTAHLLNEDFDIPCRISW